MEKTIARFEYNIDGQIAKAIYGDKVEEFMWDGLALIWRSGVTYINEPYVTGGNPVMAGDDVLFNDMLGSTLAVNGKPVEMTAFGETTDANAFFTGKPMIPELGYSFLFRDYNPHQGKWTTSDPLGYPDGWNNLAYVNNEVIGAVDICGTFIEGKVQDAAQAAIDKYINAQALNALLNSLASGYADKDLELKGNFKLVISGIKIEYQVKNFFGTDNESTTLGNQNKSLELSSTLIRTDPNVYNKRNPSGDSVGPAADVSLSCRASVGFLTKYDEDLREPLVHCQVSQVSMHVARGSVSWLSSHGRGIATQDILKHSLGLSRVAVENPGFPQLVPVTSGSFSLCL